MLLKKCNEENLRKTISASDLFGWLKTSILRKKVVNLFINTEIDGYLFGCDKCDEIKMRRSYYFGSSIITIVVVDLSDRILVVIRKYRC